MKRFLTWAALACLIAPQIAAAQSPAIQHLLRYKRPAVAAGGCTFPSSGLTKIIELDPADTSKIFTTIAGSTPPGDGDPVGRIVDKNGSYALTAASDGSTRLTYRTNSGKPYMEADGIDDGLRNLSAAIGLYGSNSAAVTIGLAVRAVAGDQGSIIMESHSSGSSQYNPARQQAADFNDLVAWIRQDGGTYSLDGGTVGAYSDEILPAATDASVIITDSNTTVSGYLDNSLTTGAKSYTRSGTVTLSSASLGARSLSGAALNDFFEGRIYYVIAYDSVLNSTDRAALDVALKCTQGR